MKVNILGVLIDNLRLEEVLQKVEGFIKDSDKHYIVTPNPEFVVAAQKDLNFAKILNSADLAIPDGVGLKIAGTILGKERIRERVTGVDLMLEICRLAARKGFKVGLLGGKGDVSEKAALVLKNQFPKLRLRVFKENDPITSEVVILFVAIGAPKQEKWIAKNLPKIPVKIAMGVGGAFEMIAGIQRRAPKFIQSLGLEWLWRLVLQPLRIKRQLALPVFSFLVLKQKFFPSSNP